MPLVTQTDLENAFQCKFDESVEANAIAITLADAEASVLSFLDRTVTLDSGRSEVHHILVHDYRLFAKERIDGNLVVEERPPGGSFVTLTEDEDYVVVNQAEGRLHRIFSELAQKSWFVGYNTVRLTYDAGWTTPPLEISQVISEIAYAKYLFNQKQGEGDLIAGAMVNERMGDYNIRYGDVRASAGEQSLAGGGIGISKAHQRMLSPFRRRHIA